MPRDIQDGTQAPWRLQLLGELRATRGPHMLSRFRTRKTGLLLAYLAYYPRRAHLRDELIDLFWPDVAPQAGRDSLSTALTWLRQAMELPGDPAGNMLWADRAGVQLNPDAVTTDVAAFDAALREAGRSADGERSRWLTQAVESYSGEMLPGELEDWVLQERQWLAERYFRALPELLGSLEASGERDRAVALARRGITIDPLQEEVQRELIRLLAAGGQREAALRQYRELERLLEKHLEAEPALETRALLQTLERGEVFRPEPEPPREAPPAAPAAPLGDLPLMLTRFFDREREAAGLIGLLQQNDAPARAPRLVTLTGPGGSGKTRLALEVANRLRPAWDGAVWFVPLLDLDDPRRLIDQIRVSLRLPPDPEREVFETVSAFLLRQPTLLLLDNVEHLLTGSAPLTDAVEQIRRLLARVPTLTFVATSRLRLGLPGEQEFPVPPLPTPSAQLQAPGSRLQVRADPNLEPGAWSLERLLSCPSVQLFLDRAQSMRPGFAVTPANLEAVAELCQGLEGLPLAVELAAARVSVLTPRQMVTRLSRRFDLLESRQREIDPRHRSLRATLAWSYQLLSPESRRFLAQLSVFRGGWTLASAEAVCDALDGLDCMEQLQEASLVLSEESGTELRFRMLETVREFAAEQLAPAERPAAERRHAGYFLGLAEEAAPELEGPAQAEWLARLQMEHDNLRAALSWVGRDDETEDQTAALPLGLRLTGALWRFWWAHGHLVEGSDWLADVLSRTRDQEPSRERGRALVGAGRLAYEQGKRDAARAYLEEALETSRAVGDPLGIALALHDLGDLTFYVGDHSGARARYEESLATHREIGHRAGVAKCLHQLGEVASQQSDWTTAQALLDECLSIRRELGDLQGSASTLMRQGYLAHLRGDLALARTCIEESLAIQRRIENRKGIAWSLNFLGDVVGLQGDPDTARACYTESLQIARAVASPWGVGWALSGLGDVALAEGDLEAARSLYEQSLASARELGNRNGAAGVLRNLGQTALRQQRAAEAVLFYAESFEIQHEMGNRRGVAVSLDGLAQAAADLERLEPAVRLFGASAATWEALGPRHLREDVATIDAHLARLRAALGDAPFDATWESGRRTAWEELPGLSAQESEPERSEP